MGAAALAAVVFVKTRFAMALSRKRLATAVSRAILQTKTKKIND
jgi:hypothetical protein